MSQQQWGESSGGRSVGSVKRARERMETGLPPETPQMPPKNRYNPSKQAPSPPSGRPRPQMPQALQSQGPKSVAISRPTQIPQWPLAGTIETVQDQKSHQHYQPPSGRGAPPQRPPRPSDVPSMLDGSRVQEHTPAFQYKPQQDQRDTNQEMVPIDQRDATTTQIVDSPETHPSRTSSISSVGTISDFPVPMQSQPHGPPRRSANLGPPPSSRRGVSSYYSQASYVSPIPEESPRIQPSHCSYASSAAMPTSWGSNSPGYVFDDEDDYAKYGQDKRFANDVIEEGRESRESNLDDSDDRGLIRNASLGKRAKPSMVTTKSAERIEMQRPSPQPEQKPNLERLGVLPDELADASGPVLAAGRHRAGPNELIWPMFGDPDSPLAGGTGWIDKSSSSSENDVPLEANSGRKKIAEPVPSGPGASAMLGAYNAASSLQPPGTNPIRTPSPGFNRHSAVRRPPRLDIDAVRDAEARGSLTSLSDLIRRATKLATMIDRGKRPGSRLNELNDFPSVSDLARDKEMGLSHNAKRQSGLSGMLAAFPSPGFATPTRGDSPRIESTWPVIGPPGVDHGTSKPKKHRRCCGLPCWGFFLTLLILLIVIVAAVVLPLELVVYHKPKTSSASTATALQSCSENLATACQNGGTSSLSTGTCSCICINGFTGSTCSVAGASGCTTITLTTDPSYTNVTLGSSIPRLIAAAEANFSIPLSGAVILARFNAASLSCVTENAFVTFNGQSQPMGAEAEAVYLSTTSSTAAASFTSPSKKLRRNAASSATATPAVATMDGILFDPSSNTPPAAIATATVAATALGTVSASSSYTPAATSSAANSVASTNPEVIFSITNEVLDFAGIAVLYVLQQENLNSAASAQTNLQRFLTQTSSTKEAAQNVILGNGNIVNLVEFIVALGNGSVGTANPSTRRRSLIEQRRFRV